MFVACLFKLIMYTCIVIIMSTIFLDNTKLKQVLIYLYYIMFCMGVFFSEHEIKQLGDCFYTYEYTNVSDKPEYTKTINIKLGKFTVANEYVK